jgi:hypothetical protein
MEQDLSFEEKIEALTTVQSNYDFDPMLVKKSSVSQLIRAHELKYIENILEVEEENKLVYENIDDFLAYPEDVQKRALEAYKKARIDPEYFSGGEADQDLYKPVLILTNIDTKKNEAKVKTWKVEYHARLIGKLTEFEATVVESLEERLVNFFKKLFKK